MSWNLVESWLRRAWLRIPMRLRVSIRMGCVLPLCDGLREVAGWLDGMSVGTWGEMIDAFAQIWAELPDLDDSYSDEKGWDQT